MRASLVCDGRSIPLLSQIVPSEKQNNTLIQNQFLDFLAKSISPKIRVIIITDAGFHSAWFRHIKSLGWDFIGRIRNNVKFSLENAPQAWLTASDCSGKERPEYMGAGCLWYGKRKVESMAISISTKNHRKTEKTNGRFLQKLTMNTDAQLVNHGLFSVVLTISGLVK